MAIELIEGEKIILRPATMADAGDTYLSWLNDPEVIRSLENVPQPYTMNMLEDFIRGILQTPNSHLYIVVDKASGSDIGTMRIHSIHPVHRTGHIGQMIGDKNMWGKGYGTDLLKTGLRHGFQNLGIRKFTETVNVDNAASIAMLHKCGFEREGLLKEHVYSNGILQDKYVYSVFAKDWKG